MANPIGAREIAASETNRILRKRVALDAECVSYFQSDRARRLRWQQVHPLCALASFAVDWLLATNAVFLLGSDESPDEDLKSLNAAANLLAYNGLAWIERCGRPCRTFPNVLRSLPFHIQVICGPIAGSRSSISPSALARNSSTAS